MVSHEDIKLLLEVQRSGYNDMVSNLMTTFNERLSKIEKEVCDLRAENSLLRQAQQQQTANIEDFVQKLEGVEGVCEGVRIDAHPINTRLDDLEDRSRKNNLRFDGIAESYRENWEQTAEHVGKLVREKLGVAGDVSIQRAHRVGNPNSDRPRTIIVNFLRFQDRQEILRNRHKLRDTNIFVNEDLCAASIAKQRQQWPELQRAMKEGKTAFFVHTKLIIKEKIHVGGGHNTGSGSQETSDGESVVSDIATGGGRGSGTAGGGRGTGAAGGGRGSCAAGGGRGTGATGGGRGSGAAGGGRGSGAAEQQRDPSRGRGGRGSGSADSSTVGNTGPVPPPCTPGAQQRALRSARNS